MAPGSPDAQSPTASSPRMTSPIHCMHPECMAASSDSDHPRCLKLLPPPTPTGSSAPRFKQIKLQCDKCNDYPDGFRSEHELRRHTNRVHREVRKVWITVDASPDKTFLATCKACQSGKRYNECYNAASHLRRMHFHPRKRGEGKGEKRGGAGSVRSEDPPMDFLKKDWLREVEEVIGEGSEAGADDASNPDDRMDVDEDETEEDSPIKASPSGPS